jgi:hypothetical protein
MPADRKYFDIFTLRPMLMQFAVFLILTSGPAARAQIISPSAEEVQFSYSALMTGNRDQGFTAKEFVEFHASHIFGIFHSPKMIQRFGLDESLVEGIGSPQNGMNIKIISQRNISATKVRISYQASGKMILHKKAAAILLNQKTMTIPLPVDPYEIYNEKCTDPHYTTFGEAAKSWPEPRWLRT